MRPVSWSWNRGISSGFPRVWHVTLLPSAPSPPAGWPLFCLGSQICHTELLLSPSHISHTRFLFQSSKYPPTTSNKVCLTPLDPRSVCEARLTLASAPQALLCPNAKSNPQVPAPLLRPELSPVASRYWKKRLQMSWNPPNGLGRVLDRWSTIRKVFLSKNWSISEYNFYLRFWFCHLLTLHRTSLLPSTHTSFRQKMCSFCFSPQNQSIFSWIKF